MAMSSSPNSRRLEPRDFRILYQKLLASINWVTPLREAGFLLESTQI